METTEYPRMLYHDDGRTAVAEDSEHESSFGAGWSRDPSDLHRRSGTPEAPNVALPPVHASNHDDLVERVADRVVEKLEAAGAFKRGPGRPPKSLAERSASRVGPETQESED